MLVMIEIYVMLGSLNNNIFKMASNLVLLGKRIHVLYCLKFAIATIVFIFVLFLDSLLPISKQIQSKNIFKEFIRILRILDGYC